LLLKRRFSAEPRLHRAPESMGALLPKRLRWPEKLAAVARAKQPDRILVHVLDDDQIHHAVEHVWIAIEVGAQIAHALLAQIVEQSRQGTRVELKQRDRHVFEQMPIAPLAVLLDMAVGGDVHQRSHKHDSALVSRSGNAPAGRSAPSVAFTPSALGRV